MHTLKKSIELDRVSAITGIYDHPIHYKKIVNISSRIGTMLIDFGGYKKISHCKKLNFPTITSDRDSGAFDLYLTDVDRIIKSVICHGNNLRRLAIFDGLTWSLEQEFDSSMYVIVETHTPGTIVVSFDQAV